MKRTAPALLLLCSILTAPALVAAPITFNTALPVARQAFVIREQAIARRFKDDSSPLGRDLDVNAVISVLGYGVTPKLALFTALPYVDKSLDLTVDGQRQSRSSRGLGDLKAFARYTVLQRDGRGETFRIAGFGGFKAPTGKDNERDNLGILPIPMQSGTGAWDGFAGLVLTYQTLPLQVDAQVAYEYNGRANHFEMGDEARADVSLQYRLLPREMRFDTASFLYGVLEMNLLEQKKNSVRGRNDPNSGGTTVFLTPGIQFVTPRYILEAAVQLPVIQDLHGNALETDYIITMGFRINL